MLNTQLTHTQHLLLNGCTQNHANEQNGRTCSRPVTVRCTRGPNSGAREASSENVS